MTFTPEEIAQLQSMMEEANAEIARLLYQNRHLKNRNAKLVEALKGIANPIRHFQETVEREGMQLNGQMAVQLSNSADYLKEIAEKAIEQNKI
jgi:hypothetical protein